MNHLSIINQNKITLSHKQMVLINRSKYKIYLKYFYDIKYLISEHDSNTNCKYKNYNMLLLCKKINTKNWNQIIINQIYDMYYFNDTQKAFIRSATISSSNLKAKMILLCKENHTKLLNRRFNLFIGDIRWFKINN